MQLLQQRLHFRRRLEVLQVDTGEDAPLGTAQRGDAAEHRRGRAGAAASRAAKDGDLVIAVFVFHRRLLVAVVGDGGAWRV